MLVSCTEVKQFFFHFFIFRNFFVYPIPTLSTAVWESVHWSRNNFHVRQPISCEIFLPLVCDWSVSGLVWIHWILITFVIKLLFRHRGQKIGKSTQFGLKRYNKNLRALNISMKNTFKLSHKWKNLQRPQLKQTLSPAINKCLIKNIPF